MPRSFVFKVRLEESFAAAVDKVTAALKAEGFGVLTTIDVQAAFKEKLEKSFRPYVILGACHPALAYRALESVPEVGALLPCNVAVEEGDDGVLVSIIDPAAMLGMEPLALNPTLCEVGEEARTRLARVAEALGGGRAASGP